MKKSDELENLFRAVLFATAAHTGQVRKGSDVPYIVHPLGVMQLLIEHGASNEAVIAGVLHDVLEDTPRTFADIVTHFGPRVAEIVDFASESDKKLSWEERKQETINRIIATTDVDQLHVACCDKLHNAMALKNDFDVHGDELWARFNKGADSQAWYYTSMAKAFLKKRKMNQKLTHKYNDVVTHLFNNGRQR